MASSRVGIAFECLTGQCPRITSVELQSPAQTAGLEPNDRILSVGTVPTFGFTAEQLAKELSFGGENAVLQIARHPAGSVAASAFFIVLARRHNGPAAQTTRCGVAYVPPPHHSQHSARGARDTFPNWAGQPDHQWVQLADGTKRDRDFFETSADMFDSLWKPPKVKARPPAPRPLRTQIHGEAFARPQTQDWSTWDPFAAVNQMLPSERGKVAAPPNTEHTRQQQTRNTEGASHETKALWSPAGQVRTTGVSHTARAIVQPALFPAESRGTSDAQGLWKPAGLVRIPGSQPTISRTPAASRGPAKHEGDVDWYLIQQTVSHPYPSSRKMAPDDSVARFTPDGYIDVVLLHASDLPLAATFGLADAYCTCSMDKCVLSTRVINNHLHPTFNTILRFPASRPQGLTVRVLNKTLLGDSEIGRVTVPLEDVRKGQAKEFSLFSSGGKRVTGADKTPSSLRLQVRIGHNAMGGLIASTRRGAGGLLVGQASALISTWQGHGAHISATEGVTMTLEDDYLTVKNRESTWHKELGRDVCHALRCEPGRFEYVGTCPWSGSVLATFNLLPPQVSDADKRTARNLASELTLQIYAANSPLKQSLTTASAMKVELHAPQKPLHNPLKLGPPSPPSPTHHHPPTNGYPESQQGVPRPSNQIVFGTNAYSAILQKSIDSFAFEKISLDKVPAKELRDHVSQDDSSGTQHTARPAFGSEAILPVLGKMFAPVTGPFAKDGTDVPDIVPATLAHPEASAPPAPRPAMAPASDAAIRMRLALPFEECGTEGSPQRDSFKRSVTSDLARSAGIPDSCFNTHIVAMSAGSIIVDTEIHANQSILAAGCDPLATALDLQVQARCVCYASVGMLCLYWEVWIVCVSHVGYLFQLFGCFRSSACMHVSSGAGEWDCISLICE